MNLIYLGLITERVPIIPRFAPRHLQPSSSELDFGEIFDIPLQWSQVQEPYSQYIDELGCWNVQNTMRHTSGLYHDVSYTTPPDLQKPELSPAHRVALPPDEHLLWYDMLCYLSLVWRFVVAESYFRKTLGIAADAPIPPV
ncbi:hypothetical protein B0H11DRAFT_2035682 [Mycena galericulata]|nr:hypothetical protein B0H11DRAFT_2035682 [Mycena galericulata]